MPEFTDLGSIMSKLQGDSNETVAEPEVTTTEEPVVTSEPEKVEEPEVAKTEEPVAASEPEKVEGPEKTVEPEPEKVEVPKVTKQEEKVEDTAPQIDEAEYSSLKSFKEKIDGNEFIKNLIDYYERTGDVKAYIENQGIDYEKDFDDLGILRTKFEKENSDLPKNVREKLFAKELNAKYGYDVTGEEFAEVEDLEMMQALMKRDADKVRSEFKEEQSKFKIPDPVEPKVQDTVAQEQDALASNEAEQKYLQMLESNPDVNNLRDNKSLPVDTGVESDDTFVYEIDDPQDIIETMKSGEKFFQLFQGEKGFDANRMAKAIAYAKDPATFEKSMVDFGRTIERESQLKEAKNTDGAISSNAKGSQPVNEMDGLLQAFVKKKREMEAQDR